MNELDLTGLKAHHPLGFLAACGLLRCLMHAKDLGPTKLGWRIADDNETFAVLFSEHPVDIDAIVCTLLQVAKRQCTSHAWGWSKKVDDKTKFRETARTVVRELVAGTATRDDADMLAALASDLISRRDKDRELLEATAFDCTSANQGLLRSFLNVADWPAKASGFKTKVKRAGAGGNDALKEFRDKVEEGLNGPWTYRDDPHSLGWDPQTQRLHALRWKAPAEDKRGRSVRVAVFLGSLALPLFPCFAVGSELRTTGIHRQGRSHWFCWPIWRGAISLDTVRCLLSHRSGRDLKERGVHLCYRCRIAHTGSSQGNYRVFGQPEEHRPWRVPGVPDRGDPDASTQRRTSDEEWSITDDVRRQ